MFDVTERGGPERCKISMIWDRKIPLRDGVHLSATLYLPEGLSLPQPAIFTLTPYIAQSYHDVGVYFSERGFPFLTVDVRGRGNSEGQFKPFINEGRDGHDVVEWIALQPFCNGKVAMWGGSYAGLDQWNTARELPPHLATIVPVASPYIGVDFPIRNNIAAPYLVQWLTLVAGRTSQDKIFWNNEKFWGERFARWFTSGRPFRELDTFLGIPTPIFQEWLEHPHQDPYWDAYNPRPEQYAKISLPVLTITGSHDDDQPGALAHYREHLKCAPEARERHFLIIGPWDHGGTRTPKANFLGITIGPEGVVDLLKLHLEWYRWTMQGGPMPSFLRKRVAYYVLGAEKWRYADSLEEITSRLLALYFHSSGTANDVFGSGLLFPEPPQDDYRDHYVYDPRATEHAELESTVNPEWLTDQRMVHALAGYQLIYDSAPFGDDMEISGFFKLSLWLSIDRPDTDIRVSLYEIAIDGTSILLTFDSMRARYRESLREERLIRTDDPLRYDFERFTFISRKIRKGSRLRLVVGPIHSIYSQRNCNNGGVIASNTLADAATVNVMLHHGRTSPSVLQIPLGRPEASNEAAAPRSMFLQRDPE